MILYYLNRQRALLLLLLCYTLAANAQKKDKWYYKEQQLPGVKTVTVFGKYKVWTQKVGSGPVKLLMLHGGPAGPHEYLEDLANSLAGKGIEVYLYEQLGSYYSDQPKPDSNDMLWSMPQRIEEVEQVRAALGLDTFYLYGHSWGAALGLAYVQRFPAHVKGFIFSNMNMDYAQILPRIIVRRHEMDSLLKADKRARKLAARTKAWPAMKSGRLFYRYYLVRSEGAVPQLLIRNARHHHDALNDILYNNMIRHGNYLAKLPEIKTPMLLLGSDHDFCVSSADMEKFAKLLPDAQAKICRNSGHMAMFDSAEYEPFIFSFLNETEQRNRR